MGLRYGPTASAHSRSRSGPWCAAPQPGVHGTTKGRALSLPDRARRWSARGAAAVMALLAASAATQAAAIAAQAGEAPEAVAAGHPHVCLLYTSDAADE